MKRQISIGQRQVGSGAPCYLIAEVGTTCLGDLEMALDLVASAATAGVDAVKFQVIDTEQMSDKSETYRVEWGDGVHEMNMRDMFAALQFTPAQWQQIADVCKSIGVEFLATVDYEAGVEMLEGIGVPAHKIGAWDTTFKQLITRIAVTGKPMIVDLGPTTQDEINQLNAWFEEAGGTQIVYLHDFHTSDAKQMNMLAIRHLESTLPWPVGFSSPARNDDLDFLALGIGVDVIEKRLILDRSLKAIHSHESLEPDELKDWVRRIRFAEHSLGVPEIRPSERDVEGSCLYYRSICTTMPIATGAVFTRENLGGKRPGTGIPTARLEQFLGKRATRDIDVDTLLTEGDLS